MLFISCYSNRLVRKVQVRLARLSIIVILTGDTFEDSGKQNACDCCGEEASSISHATARGQIAGTYDKQLSLIEHNGLHLSYQRLIRCGVRGAHQRLVCYCARYTARAATAAKMVLAIVMTTQQLNFALRYVTKNKSLNEIVLLMECTSLPG